ncbi:MAG TPA: M48 family metallopeptidase [Chitinophagaceae bacterium]|nr:M48 family metallopeptidase [Chitinophagaceae bacterium]
MNGYNAIYHFNEEEHKAEVTLLKNKLLISLEGQQKIFWYYYQIRRDNVYSFQYTNYPVQSLRVNSSALADELERRMQQDVNKANLTKLAPLAKVLLVFLLIAVLAYVFIMPWAASALANRFPVSYEKKIGEEAYASIRRGFQVDEKRTILLNDFFQQLDFPSEYNVQVTVVKGEEVNAFAMPGGHVVVYDKLLNSTSSYPELCALLAHEFTHIENRHTIRTLFRQLGSGIFMSLLLGDASAVGGAIIRNADYLKNLSYSRALEKEADENGLRLLSERGIDPDGFVRLFQLLGRQNKGSEATEWLSSHPNLNKRIKAIKGNLFYQRGKHATDTSLHRLFLQIQTLE